MTAAPAARCTRVGDRRRIVRSVVHSAHAAAPVAESAQGDGARVALVIGNAAYRAADRLASPNADAQLVADGLRTLGFATETVLNQTRTQMLDALEHFSQRASHASIAFVYYAGHGFESAGANYLVPVDIPVPIHDVTLADRQRSAVSLRYVRSTASRGEPRC
ncbi:caspase family protein [Caballeronia ptereochthonis]|uniref:Peptidase C14, caspase catalytic subunit p20 n=1 Tax=Caballeronia ptereochthonis TaxID=1777144 RepID=A0A158CDJ3_9BURK|nr:caspase family protein [Caballeronia ptereochthonis]SAK80382.1 peptidase C14, caspase catalytic subunit p20 [Caballeronia ptereochthonis]